MSLGGGGGGQMQEIEQQLEQLEQVKAALEGEIEDLRDEKYEIDEAIDALGQLEDGSTVQVPVGGDAYVRAEVQDIDEIIVKLGGDYAAELGEDDAVETLEAKKENLDDRIAELEDEITEVETETEELEQQARQAQQQQLQQLQQQMQGQQGQPPRDDE